MKRPLNNQLKVNVDKQQDDIKYLKEQCNKDDKYKVQETAGAGTPMKKNKYVCLTCNQTCEVKKWLKHHIMEGHTIQCKTPFPI